MGFLEIIQNTLLNVILYVATNYNYGGWKEKNKPLEKLSLQSDHLNLDETRFSENNSELKFIYAYLAGILYVNVVVYNINFKVSGCGLISREVQVNHARKQLRAALKATL